MRDFPVLMFAAGFGTRMQHLTQDRPKPMIEVAGKPLVDHALALTQVAGCSRVVANLHYKPDALRHHLHAKGVQTILETPDILETGGGLRNALGLLGGNPVMTLNTDAVWAGPNPIALLREAWRPEHMDALLICIPPDQAIGHHGAGDFTLGADGLLQRGPGVIYGGVQIIKTGLLADISTPKFSLNVIWDQMLANGRLSGLSYPGMWCDVGHPDGIAMAENMLEAHDV